MLLICSDSWLQLLLIAQNRMRQKLQCFGVTLFLTSFAKLQSGLEDVKPQKKKKLRKKRVQSEKSSTPQKKWLRFGSCKKNTDPTTNFFQRCSFNRLCSAWVSSNEITNCRENGTRLTTVSPKVDLILIGYEKKSKTDDHFSVDVIDRLNDDILSVFFFFFFSLFSSDTCELGLERDRFFEPEPSPSFSFWAWTSLDSIKPTSNLSFSIEWASLAW